jgi:hypothetical protein
LSLAPATLKVAGLFGAMGMSLPREGAAVIGVAHCFAKSSADPPATLQPPPATRTALLTRARLRIFREVCAVVCVFVE